MPPQNAATITYPIAESIRAESPEALVPASAAEEVILPQTLSGLFDAAFDLYKRHFTTIALPVACIYLPTLALYNLMQSVWLRPLVVAVQEDKGDAAGVAGLKLACLGFVALVVLTFGLVLASGPATAAIAEASENRAISVREAFRRAMPAFPRLITHGLAAILATLCMAALTFFLTVMLVGLASLALISLKTPALASLGAVLMLAVIFIVPYLCGGWLLARYFLLTPALTVLENLPLGAMIERNGHLARKAGFGRVWLAAMFLPLVTIGLQVLVSYAVESVISALHLSPFMVFSFQTGASALFSFLLQPYWIIFLCLLYFDCRVRRDGLDVSRLAESAGLAHPASPLQSSPTLAIPLTIYSITPAAPGRTAPQMPYRPTPPPVNPPPGERRQ